jgi:Zn-dependent protease with chaperone function
VYDPLTFQARNSVMSAPRTDLRASGDRDLAERILREPGVANAIERYEKRAAEMGARRELLARALRLTPEMAPEVHAIVAACREALGLETPLETYVYPELQYNAMAVRPERGRLFVMFSAGLLEGFEPDELRFVVGHELGHHLFEHHKIPAGALLGPGVGGPGLPLRLFAWQRYAEISSDRAGLLCAGSLEPVARGLFKLASGLRGSRVKVRIDQFLAQVGDLREESERLAKSDEPVRSDWFATHPFSPLRVRAAELCARSELMVPGGLARAELEAEVDELVRLMDPSYLRERSEAAEAMRRLLFAGAVLIAGSGGEVSKEALGALEGLLGAGAVPRDVNLPAIREDLPRRIARVREVVPPLRRAQVIRDLCVIVRADRVVTEAETRVLSEIATAVGVDNALVACTVEGSPDSYAARA